MLKIAFYGKGGIGKSTTVTNLALALAEKGLKVMQIGCDPKADSTASLLQGKRYPTVLECLRETNDIKLEDIVRIGLNGVLCVEAGGPIPGMGCAGRGIINALEKLSELDAYNVYNVDVVLFDVLGDVVCGGFAMPMRKGYADMVLVITSGENMSIYAAGNIAMALANFQNRNYAVLGGFIQNSRNVTDEDAKVDTLANDFKSSVIYRLPHSELVQQAEAAQKPLLAWQSDSTMADNYRKLAENICSAAVEKTGIKL